MKAGRPWRRLQVLAVALSALPLVAAAATQPPGSETAAAAATEPPAGSAP